MLVELRLTDLWSVVTDADRFWGFWAFCVTFIILHSPDSPATMLADYRTWYVDLLLCYTSFVFMRGFVRWQEQRRLGEVRCFTGWSLRESDSLSHNTLWKTGGDSVQQPV